MNHQRLGSEEAGVRAIIARDFTAGLMNNTKWAELANCLQDLPLKYRFKWVDVENAKEVQTFRSVPPRFFDSSPFGPFLTLSIEWLEIDPQVRVPRGVLQEPAIEDRTAEVAHRLTSISVPYFHDGHKLRIVGHVRKT